MISSDLHLEYINSLWYGSIIAISVLMKIPIIINPLLTDMFKKNKQGFGSELF